MTPNNDQEREDRALEALLAAAFRIDADRPIDEQEAAELMKNPPCLSKEDQAETDSWGDDLVDRLLTQGKIVSERGEAQEGTLDPAISQAYMAMHRGKEGEELSEEAKEEIERKRRELLGETGDGQESTDGS